MDKHGRTPMDTEKTAWAKQGFAPPCGKLPALPGYTDCPRCPATNGCSRYPTAFLTSAAETNKPISQPNKEWETKKYI